MCTPLRHRIIPAVNVDRTGEFEIFILKLSQLSYPRNVLMSDMIELNSEYLTPRNYLFQVSFLLS